MQERFFVEEAKMDKYIGTIKISCNVGNQMPIFPVVFIKDQNLKAGDTFHVLQAAENLLMLTPIVRMSWFRHEIRKVARASIDQLSPSNKDDHWSCIDTGLDVDSPFGKFLIQ